MKNNGIQNINTIFILFSDLNLDRFSNLYNFSLRCQIYVIIS